MNLLDILSLYPNRQFLPPQPAIFAAQPKPPGINRQILPVQESLTFFSAPSSPSYA